MNPLETWLYRTADGTFLSVGRPFRRAEGDFRGPSAVKVPGKAAKLLLRGKTLDVDEAQRVDGVPRESFKDFPVDASGSVG